MAWTSAVDSWVAPTLSRLSRRQLLVTEQLDLHNASYVRDNRASYDFGRSETADVQGAIVELQRFGKVVQVGHSVANDISWLGVACNLDNVADNPKTDVKERRRNSMILR